MIFQNKRRPKNRSSRITVRSLRKTHPLRIEQLENRSMLAWDVIISEVMASNSETLRDADGDSSDWIELHNTSAETIQLGGWHLSDDSDNPARWSLPAVELAADGFLVIFASGKNRTADVGELHTDFRLSSNGEYLALSRPDLSVAHEFRPSFPPLPTDVGFGAAVDGTELRTGFMTTPTPGAPNEQLLSGFLQSPTVDVEPGLFESEFQLTMSASSPLDSIRYTTDGTTPTAATGSLYTGPISVTTTTTLRAASFRANWIPSEVETRSYVFLADVLNQTQPDGYPDLPSGDFDMDPDVANSSQYRERLLQGLREIPSMSIVMNPEDFLGTRGIYSNPTSRGAAWERPASIELIEPNGELGFQIDAGIRIQGGASRSPSTPKHSFSLRFRDDYGAPSLTYPLFKNSPVDTFHSLSLRAGSNNSWINSAAEDQIHAQYIRDQWIRDSLLAMGHADAGRGTFAHLYVNGLYWGVFNLTERPEADHYAEYFGGSGDQYDAYNGSELIDGSGSALAAVREAASNRDWNALQQLLDVDQYIDYQIINRYGSNGDLDASRNYRMAGGGSDSAAWRIYSWDAEETLESSGSTGEPTDPLGLRHDVNEMPEYRMRFADRVQQHFFGSGALTPTAAQERFLRRAEQLDLAVIGESARWGDHHRKDTPYTRDKEWLTEQRRLLVDYFPIRSDVVVQLFRSEGFFPMIPAPQFSLSEHLVKRGSSLEIVGSVGETYFTTDGSDPRMEGGQLSASAQLYTTAVSIDHSQTINARARSGNDWSPLAVSNYEVTSDLPLRITEIHVDPVAYAPDLQPTFQSAESLQFIEFANLGTQAINLDGVRMVEQTIDYETHGVFYRFFDQTLLPGEFVVVARDPSALAAAHQTEIPFANGTNNVGGVPGEFDGALSVDGETLTLVDATGATIQQFHYGAALRDAPLAAGTGSSLVAASPMPLSAQPNAEDWDASGEFGGSPGAASAPFKPTILINELVAASQPVTDSLATAPINSWVELFNPTDADIDVGGWYVSDDANDLAKFRLPTDALVPAEGFLVFEQDTSQLAFDRADGGQVWLVHADDEGTPIAFQDVVKFPSSLPGQAMGRPAESPTQFEALNHWTKAGHNSRTWVADVVISEVNFDPRDGDGEDSGLPVEIFEYVELFNRSDREIALGGWRLAGNIEHEFGRRDVIPPGETLVVVPFSANRSTQANPFRAAYQIDNTVRLDGTYLGILDNEAGAVKLLQPAPAPVDRPYLSPMVVVDQVEYRIEPPWPRAVGAGAALGDAKTLTRGNVTTTPRLPTTWQADAPSPGSVLLPTRHRGDVNGDGKFTTADLVQIMQVGKFDAAVAALFEEGDLNGDGIVDINDIAGLVFDPEG